MPHSSSSSNSSGPHCNVRTCRTAATPGEQTCTARFRVRQLRVAVLVIARLCVLTPSIDGTGSVLCRNRMSLDCAPSQMMNSVWVLAFMHVLIMRAGARSALLIFLHSDWVVPPWTRFKCIRSILSIIFFLRRTQHWDFTAPVAVAAPGSQNRWGLQQGLK